MKTLLASAAILAGVFSAGSALAQTANLTIEAKVVDSCLVKFDSPTISFNIAKDSFTGAEQVSHFIAQCGNNNITVALDGGQSKLPAARIMKRTNGSETIAYAIYKGETGETIWNDSDNVYKVSAADSLGATQQAFRVVIPPSSVTSATQAGTYNDKLVATISYDAA